MEHYLGFSCIPDKIQNSIKGKSPSLGGVRGGLRKNEFFKRTPPKNLLQKGKKKFKYV